MLPTNAGGPQPSIRFAWADNPHRSLRSQGYRRWAESGLYAGFCIGEFTLPLLKTKRHLMTRKDSGRLRTGCVLVRTTYSPPRSELGRRAPGQGCSIGSRNQPFLTKEVLEDHFPIVGRSSYNANRDLILVGPNIEL
jgi:hypothetical protein